MADKPTPEAPHHAYKDPRRKKRAAPTIDLTATELPAGAAPDEAAPSGEPAVAVAGNSDRVHKTSLLQLGVAAGAGAGLAVVVLLALWLDGVIPVATGYAGALAEKVAELQKQVGELQSRPQAPNTNAVAALSRRLDKLETALAKLPPPNTAVTAKLEAADNAMKSLGIALTALGHRTDAAAASATAAREVADAASKAIAELQASGQTAAASPPPGVPRADIEALQQRVAALEAQAKAAHEAVAALQAQAEAVHEAVARNSGNDNAARLALSAEVLRSAVAVGAPYADELDEVKALGGDEKILAALAPFAASGLPTAHALARELSAVLPQMLKIAGTPPPSANFLAKLEANANQLVRIRPVHAPPGNDVLAVLARLDVDSANADIPAALADLAKLPAKLRAAAAVWIGKAKAQQVALHAARALARATARTLRPQ